MGVCRGEYGTAAHIPRLTTGLPKTQWRGAGQAHLGAVWTRGYWAEPHAPEPTWTVVWHASLQSMAAATDARAVGFAGGAPGNESATYPCCTRGRWLFQVGLPVSTRRWSATRCRYQQAQAGRRGSISEMLLDVRETTARSSSLDRSRLRSIAWMPRCGEARGSGPRLISYVGDQTPRIFGHISDEVTTGLSGKSHVQVKETHPSARCRTQHRSRNSSFCGPASETRASRSRRFVPRARAQ